MEEFDGLTDGIGIHPSGASHRGGRIALRQARTGDWRRTLTASDGSFRFRSFREAPTFLPNICELTGV